MKAKFPTISAALCVIFVLVATVCAVFNLGYTIADHKEYVAYFEYRGHNYIHVHTGGGDAITHDPDCPCHTKGGDK